MTRPYRQHDLKCDVAYFRAVWNGSKTFEVRKDDRGFEVGDRLRLNESWQMDAPNGQVTHYTGRWVERDVAYVLRDAEQFGVMPGFVVLGLSAWNSRWPDPSRGTATSDQEGQS